MQRMRKKMPLPFYGWEGSPPDSCLLLFTKASGTQTALGNFRDTLLVSVLQELICRKLQLGWCTQRQAKIPEDEISQGAGNITLYDLFPKQVASLTRPIVEMRRLRFEMDNLPKVPQLETVKLGLWSFLCTSSFHDCVRITRGTC